MITRNISAALVAVAALAFVNTAKADTYGHIDSLATSLEAQTAELQAEFSLHFRHSPYYRHLAADVSNIRRQASIVHSLVHSHTCEYRLSSVLRQMDYSFHHLEGVVARAEVAARHGFGHVDGHIAHVHHLMHDIEDTIHHLREDLALLSRPVHRPVVRPVHVDPFHGGHGGHSAHGGHGGPRGQSGVTFRSGNFTFRIGH